MSLRDKYQTAVQTAKGLRMDGSAEEREGKLHIKGTVKSVDEKNRIWDAIKSVPGWEKEVVADLRVTEAPAAAGKATSAQRTYTVKSGDTLSRIAKEFYGDAQAYTRIFDANRDQLSDPDKIRPGQVLKIPG
ncbi:MAG TPA: LysM peptidoglycan-binding domain-containing protein [Vicinamibacterales bacterium]|nr:LysM peptidoglycan-binding domain-containing protein [Vicinamibacterales bacterium]